MIIVVVKLGMNKNMTIQKLIEIMKKNGFTQVEMAFKLGISVPTLNRWLNGNSFTRSYNTIKMVDRFIKDFSENNEKEIS